MGLVTCVTQTEYRNLKQTHLLSEGLRLQSDGLLLCCGTGFIILTFV